MSWLRKVAKSAASKGAGIASAAAEQSAAALSSAMGAGSTDSLGSGRWEIEVKPNPDQRTLDLRLVDKKQQKKKERAGGDTDNDEMMRGDGLAIAWPPSITLTLVCGRYDTSSVKPQWTEARTEIAQVGMLGGAGQSASSPKCSYGPITFDCMLAVVTGSTRPVGSSMFLAHMDKTYCVVECAVSVELVASLSVAAEATVGSKATFDDDYEEFEGDDYDEPDFAPLAPAATTLLPAEQSQSRGSASATPPCLCSVPFKLDDVRPIVEVQPDHHRHMLRLSIRGSGEGIGLTWPSSIDVGPKGIASGAATAQAAADSGKRRPGKGVKAATTPLSSGCMRLKQCSDPSRANEYVITPEAVALFPSKKPRATVTAFVGFPDAAAWVLESKPCSVAAAAPRLRATPDPASNALILSVDGLGAGSATRVPSVTFPDSVALTFGVQGKSLPLAAMAEAAGVHVANTRKFGVITPGIIAQSRSSVDVVAATKQTIRVIAPQAVDIGGIAWSNLESNRFAVKGASPQLGVIPSPQTRLLRLCCIGTPNKDIVWPEVVNLTYIKESKGGAVLENCTMSIAKAKKNPFPNEVSYGPLTDDILAQVDCRPYTNDLYFSADVVIRGVGWSNVATNAALPLHVGYGMNHELFLYHVLACNAGDDAFSVAARREYWEHRTSMFLGGGAPAGALQIGRDLKVLMRREKAAVALWTVASTAVGFAGPTYKAYFTALTQAAEVGKYGAATFLLQKDIAEIISTLMKLVRSEQANLSGLTMEDATFGLYFMLAHARSAWGSNQAAIEAEHAQCADVSDEEMARVHWMLNLATWAYVEDIADLQQLMRVQGCEVIMSRPASGFTRLRPAFHVVAQRRKKLVIIAVRGTADIADVFSDLDCAPMPFTEGTDALPSTEHYSHEGMNKAADWIVSEALGTIRNFVKSGYAPVLCGHSLGGGVATLAAAKLYPEFGASLKCFGFGNPPVMTAALATQAREYAVSVCHEHDIIPRLSTSSITRLLVALREFRESWTRESGGSMALSKQVFGSYFASAFGAHGVEIQRGPRDAEAESSPTALPFPPRTGAHGVEIQKGPRGAEAESSSTGLPSPPHSAGGSAAGGGGGGGGAAKGKTMPALKIPGRILHVYKVEGVYKAKEAPSFDFDPLARIEPFLDMVDCHLLIPYRNAIESARFAGAMPGGQVPRWTGFAGGDTSCSRCARDFCWNDTFTSPAQRDLVGRFPCQMCGRAVCAACIKNSRPLPFVKKPNPQPICDDCFFVPPQAANAAAFLVPEW